VKPIEAPTHAAPAATAPDAAALGRTLRTRHVTMIAIGGIIGAGLFVGSSTSIATVGPAVIFSYAIAGLVILMIMRMLSEMAMASPGTGTFTEFVRLGLGHGAGFTCGWLYWYFWVVVIPVEAIAGGVILNNWINLPVWLLGVGLLALMTAINLLSTRSYGEFEFWLSSLKVSAIIVFILIGAAFAFGVTSPTGPTFSNLTSHRGFAPFGLMAILAGVTSVIFSVVGAEISTIAAAESSEPVKTIARAATSVAIRILLFYILSIGLIVSILPWDTVKPGASPFTAALVYMKVPGAATAMTSIVLVAVLSCLNSSIYVTSRVLFVLAAKGDAPQWLVALTRRKVPARAILVGSVFGYFALAASVLSPQLVFSFLVNSSGATMLMIYLMVCAAQVRHRRLLERTNPDALLIKMWWFPYASYITAAAILAVLVAMSFQHDLAVQLIASLAVAVIVSGAYMALRRNRSG
jgi:GABA permease